MYIGFCDMVEELFRRFPHPDDSFPGKQTEFSGRLAFIEDFRLRERLRHDNLIPPNLWTIGDPVENFQKVFQSPKSGKCLLGEREKGDD